MIKRNTLALILLILSLPASAQTDKWEGRSVDLSHGRLMVSENKRFLVFEDGTPFFYLGDTGWEQIGRAHV